MKRFAAAALALTAIASVASAGTVNFTFTGSAYGTASSSGSGSFTFSGPGPLIGLSDITAFSFTTSRDIPSLGFTSTYTYGLSDLNSFTGNVDVSGNLYSIVLVTNAVNASSTNGAAGPLGFLMGSTTTGALFYLDGEYTLDVQGSVALTSVPAPGAMGALAGAGLLAARRRRR